LTLARPLALEPQTLRDAASLQQSGDFAENFQMLFRSLRGRRAKEDDEAGRCLEGQEAQALRPCPEKDQRLHGFIDVGVEK
jgi:hypothetical protein